MKIKSSKELLMWLDKYNVDFSLLLILRELLKHYDLKELKKILNNLCLQEVINEQKN